MALKKLVAGNWKMHGLSADLAEIRGDRRRVAPISAGRRRAVRAGDPDRARGARRSRLRDRRPGRPSRREGRAHRLHLGADAARRRRGADHRRPLASGATPSARATPRCKAKAEAALACGPRRDPVRRRKPRGSRSRAMRSRRWSRSSTLRFPIELADEAELAIAYEPIWAIGTGKVPTDRRNRARCTPRSARGWIERYGAAGSRVRILYGGSVKASNAAEIFAIRRRRRRAGRRRQPQGRGFHADRRRRRGRLKAAAAIA